jgi:hypothetical protein
MNLRVFGVGFLSAFVVPVIKVYQVGYIAPEAWNFSWLVGRLLPFLLMGVLVGSYALLVNGEEKSLKTLFLNCLSVPAMLMTLVGGAPSLKEAQAIEPTPRLILTCTPPSSFTRGMKDSLLTLGVLKNKYFRKNPQGKIALQVGKDVYLMEEVVSPQVGDFDYTLCAFRN